MAAVPQISQDDLRAFHDAHFSALAIGRFGSDFLHPHPHPQPSSVNAATQAAAGAVPGHDGDDEDDDEYEDEEEEDDGLGYYPDGVKRTLTDEQVAMFRHSEMEAMRRESERKQDKQDRQEKGKAGEEGEVSEEEGEIGSPLPPPPAAKKKKNNNNNNSGKKRKNRKPQTPATGPSEKKPVVDLRKRTWDVVETGLATLDYGEEGEGGRGGSGAARAVSRRRVSYDD